MTTAGARRGFLIRNNLSEQNREPRRRGNQLAMEPSLASRFNTLRYLQTLLAENGTSFIDEVIQRRLQRAHEMLCSPLYSGMTIIDLAYHCGFASVSNFHRMFRRVFGTTPSDLRARALDAAASVSRD
jgi:AraC-like DNA-binding protein